jgi:chaperone BCS1
MLNFIESILHNPIATGLSATAIIGTIMYQIKGLPKIAYEFGVRSMTVHMIVDNRDPAFRWIDRWLSTQEYAGRTHSVTLRTAGSGNKLLSEEDEPWMLTPGMGVHWFFWKGNFVLCWRDFENGKTSENQPIEKIGFRTLGRSHNTLRELVIDAEKLATQASLVPVYVYRGGWWRAAPGKSPRLLNSLVLQDGQMDRIMNDLSWFSAAHAWYAERGIPYRRAYLFSGAPGTGKTSIVLAIAGAIKRPICALNIGSLENDDQLFDAVGEAPKNAIILIEDIDCASPAKSRLSSQNTDGEPTKVETGGVTKAGLLNALDGIGTPDGRIFILTTNFPERLDAALTRPGRADIHERFELLGAREQIRMARRFYGEVAFLPLDHPVSPAEMQAAFMRHPSDWRAARESVNRFNEERKEAA